MGVFSHRDTMQTDTSPFSLLGGKVTAELKQLHGLSDGMSWVPRVERSQS